MTWRLPDTYHSAGTRRGTATLKFYEGRDILGVVDVFRTSYTSLVGHWAPGCYVSTARLIP
jgi:hypothetical protein